MNTVAVMYTNITEIHDGKTKATKIALENLL